MTGINAALDEWRALLGAAHVLIDTELTQRLGADTGGLERRVSAALCIAEPDLVAPVLHIARRHGVPVYPISTGNNWGYGTAMPTAEDCVLLDLSTMNRIRHFDPDFGVVTVEPGVTQGQLAAFLDAGGHDFMVPATGAGPNCSLLGNALERGYGITPHADHFAAVTDLEATLADGTHYRGPMRELGSDDLARLFRWGIGPHAMGLFSQGSFGVVTSVTIVLARRPECLRVGLFGLKEDTLLEPTVDAVRRVLTRLPGVVGGLNLMNRHRVLAMTAPYPFDRLGPDGLMPAALLQEMGRQYQIQPWTGFVALFGTRRVVAAAQHEIRMQLRGLATRLLFISPTGADRIAQVARWCPGAMGRRLERTAATLASSLELVGGRPNETALPLAYWRQRVVQPARDRNPGRDGCGLMWYAPLVPMRSRQVREFVRMVQDLLPRHGLEPLVTFTSLGDRLFDSTVPLLFDRSDSASVAAARQCFLALFEAGRTIGCLPYRLGADQQALILPGPTDPIRLTDRLRAAIDPQGIVAPGRYGR